METRQEDKATHLRRAVRARIGEKLRATYEDLVKEGIPPRQAELLRRLEDAEASGPRRDSGIE
jgi:hypothetical protein